MPDLTFVLPHWLYWSGLLIFPLVAMYLARRPNSGSAGGATLLRIGYLLWLCGGFVGLHRFYVRSRLGIAYIPLFVAILYGNIKGRAALDAVSGARNDRFGAEFQLERLAQAVAEGIEGAAERVATAEQALAAATQRLAEFVATADWWHQFSGGFAIAIAVFLLVDAVLLPKLLRACIRDEAPRAPETSDSTLARGARQDTTLGVHSRISNFIDSLNGWTGEFVCYWSIIAVFVYYYEVIARYVFNSPTNWAHESMFLMFGMQYLISGAYAFREDSHVRVDVVYQYFSDRARVVIDIVTSVFFFIFAGTLLVTGWIFFVDSIEVWEVSFTEWAIQYWPVKISIAVGAALILLQGFSKLIKDIALLTGRAF